MKSKLVVRGLLALAVAAVLYIGTVVAFNVIFIPRAYHLAAFAVAATEPARAKPSWVDHFVNPALSKWLFQEAGVYCDAPSYDQGATVAGVNATVGLLVSTATVEGAKQSEVISELKRAVMRCNVNARSVRLPMLPLHDAIMSGRADLVQILLAGGADIALPLINPGKSNDGFNALQIAERARDRAKDQSAVARHENIVRLLAAHQAAMPAK
jgi:hypothetical protein